MLNADQSVVGATWCASKAGLAIATTATAVKTAAPNGAGTDYAIDGKGYHKADTDNMALTAGQTLATAYTVLLLICLDSSGTLSSVLGTAVLSTDLANGNVVLQYPQATADTCPIGAMKIANATGSSFVTGTTDLDTSNLTVTYIDLLTVPSAPETS
jgi:hypothetical protein